MNNICEVIDSLKSLRKLSPATDNQIQLAEQKLGLKFANEFKEYVKKYGAVSAKGMELIGICTYPRLDVVHITTREREINDSFPSGMYVVENTAIEGILILQNEDGEIYEFQPNGTLNKIYNSFKEYILESK